MLCCRESEQQLETETTHLPVTCFAGFFCYAFLPIREQFLFVSKYVLSLSASVCFLFFPCLVLLSQRLLTWCWTLRRWSRPPTWRTGPCSCCSVRTRRTVCPPRPARFQPTPTAACCASPPRSTTMASPTSGPKLADTPGCGTTATGQCHSV